MLAFLGCLCVLVQLSQGHPSPKVTFNGHKVLEVFHNTEDDYRKLLQMELQFGLDFWKMPKHVNDSMYVRIGPQYLNSFVKELTNINAIYTTLIEDVQELIDSQVRPSVDQHLHTDRRSVNSRANSGFILNDYHGYDVITSYLDFVSTDNLLSNGVTATVSSLGSSFEARDVKMIKISSQSGNSPKPAVFIDGGIHAREWVSPATVIYTIEQLAYNPGNDPGITDLLYNYDVYLVPVVNPDGYEYSHVSNRLWRKNRNDLNSCVGVDLNRNFPFEWDPAKGGSTNPCTDTYSGPVEQSEPETKNIVKFLQENGQIFHAYLTIHSYGQMWLYPWGYTSALPSDYTDLHNAADQATIALRSLYNKRYTIGSSTNVLYSAAGGSDDYAKGGAGIKYAYTIELRDTGRYGFVLPADQIIPTAEEFVAGLKALMVEIQKDPQLVVGRK